MTATRTRFLLLLVLLASSAGAQVIVTPPPVVELKATVPQVLRLVLEGSRDNSLSLAAVLDSAAVKAEHTLGARTFKLKPGQEVGLGLLRFFSNVSDLYKIRGYSRNGTVLLPESGDRLRGIRYRLKIGGHWCVEVGSAFEFAWSGKTPGGGLRMEVELVADALPEGNDLGIYSDSLTFTISEE